MSIIQFCLTLCLFLSGNKQKTIYVYLQTPRWQQTLKIEKVYQDPQHYPNIFHLGIFFTLLVFTGHSL